MRSLGLVGDSKGVPSATLSCGPSDVKHLRALLGHVLVFSSMSNIF